MPAVKSNFLITYERDGKERTTQCINYTEIEAYRMALDGVHDGDTNVKLWKLVANVKKMPRLTLKEGDETKQ